jgi:hypothetical protein
MSSETPPPDRPTPDQLAGIYVCVEAEERVTVPPSNGLPGQAPPGPVALRPTADELAGIYVCIEAEEGVAVADRPPPQTPPSDGGPDRSGRHPGGAPA